MIVVYAKYSLTEVENSEIPELGQMVRPNLSDVYQARHAIYWELFEVDKPRQ